MNLTPEQRKRIFEYNIDYLRSYSRKFIANSAMTDDELIQYLIDNNYIPDGNDMVAGMGKIYKNNEWYDFTSYSEIFWYDENSMPWSVWLFGNPVNFFSLLAKWLEVKDGQAE